MLWLRTALDCLCSWPPTGHPGHTHEPQVHAWRRPVSIVLLLSSLQSAGSCGSSVIEINFGPPTAKSENLSLRKFWCGDLSLGPQLISQYVFGPHTTVAAIVNLEDWVWSGWSPPRKRLAHHDVPNHSQKMLFWTPFYARGWLIQMIWKSCKRLAQQFDLNQFQKEIVAHDFPLCKEQQKILVVLDLLFAKKKPHHKKKQMLIVALDIFAKGRYNKQWSFVLDSPLCKRSFQPMIQIEDDQMRNFGMIFYWVS